MAQISTEIPYQNGIVYGRGVDSLTGMMRGFGVERGPEEEIPNAGGQIITYYLNKVESTADLEKSLGLRARLSAQFGLFGASAKFAFAQDSAFNSYSVFLVARMAVANAFRQIVDVKLDAESGQLLMDGRKERFRELCGDAYVAGLQTGGEFCAVLELRTQSTTDQMELSAKLSGSYALAASGSAEFSTRMREASTNRFLKVSMYQAGGTETTTTNSVDEVLKRVYNYAEGVQAEPVPHAALILDYGTLDLPEGPSPIDVEVARNVLLQYARQNGALLKLQNDINYVRENQDQFISPDINALNAAAADIADRLNKLVDNAKLAADDVRSATYIDVGIPPVQLPQRKEGTATPVTPPEFAVPNLIGQNSRDLYNDPAYAPFREQFNFQAWNEQFVLPSEQPVDIIVSMNPAPGEIRPKGTTIMCGVTWTGGAGTGSAGTPSA
jgi:hypothetical protein